MRALADNASSRGRMTLALTAIFFVIAVAFGAPVFGLLDTTGNPFTAPDSETEQVRERLQRAAGEEEGVGLIALVETEAGIESAPARERVEMVARTFEDDPTVARVFSPYETGDQAQVSRDGRSAYVAAVFRDLPEAELEDAVARLNEALADAPGVLLGGSALAGDTVGEQVGEDIGRAESIAFPILFALSLLFFRGFVAALLPLFVGVLTIFGGFLALRLVNEAVPVSIFVVNLVIALGLGLAIDYSLFMVSRYREELARAGPGQEAMRRTLATAGRTVLFSTLTIAVALAALLIFPQQFLYSMGIGGILVALIAAAISLIALPALLAVLGTRVNALAPRRWQRAADEAARQQGTGGWYRLSRAVMRRPVLVASVTALALLLLGTQFLRIEFTGFGAGDLPESSTPRQVDDILRAEFPPNPTSALQVAVETDSSGEVATLGQRIEGLPAVADVEEPIDLGGGTWRLDVIPEGEPFDESTQQLVSDLRALDTSAEIGVTGEGADFVDQQASLESRLPLGIAVLSVGTLLLLFLFTGSVVLPVKSLVMNVLTISAAFGLLVLIFQDGRLEGALGYESAGALEATQPVLLFALAFGLSTDYAVFLLSRIKEARDGGLDDREAVAVGLERTGRIVTAAAILFCVAIGAFATSKITFIKELGIGTALAVLIDATIIRALLVPSLMVLLGSRNWWAPDFLRRLHRRAGLSESGSVG